MDQQSQLHRYLYANRGCTTKARDEDFLSPDEECGFASVQCSHDGGEVTVNKQNVASHEQSCEFRSVTCEECDEAFKQKDYDKHSCVLQRKLTEVTRILQEIQGGQLLENHPQATRGQEDKNLVQPTRQPTVQEGAEVFVETTQMQQIVTRRLAGQIEKQPNSKPRPQGKHQITRLSMSPDYSGETRFISNRSQRQPFAGEIVVAGGASHSKKAKSYEIFDWSTEKWTLFKDALFFDHTNGFSFFYDDKVMFCGGTQTNRLECLDIANYRTVCTLPVELSSTNCGKGVLCGDEILTFGESVSGTSLQNPSKRRVRVLYDRQRKYSNYGIARVNDNAVVVVGGNNVYTSDGHAWVMPKNKFNSDEVALYNPSTNVIKKLAPLPYGLRDMAVVAHKENIIILGGIKMGERKGTNEVLRYNITKQQCSKLPSMLEKRSNFAAVIIGDIIVVFGGTSTNQQGQYSELNTAEYLVLGENSWKKLPPMHYERVDATACVLP